ncbi:MAG: hypothetical protein CL561_06595 [Alphaproteobacteria bacterium]|nr:hypothetical protein [Alphaproteobacteria bacterium]
MSLMSFFHKNISSLRYRIALGLSSAVLALCPWQAAQAESLFEAVEKTLANHPRQESAMLRLEAAADKRREEKSAFFPTLSGNAAGGRVYGDNSTSRGLSVTRGSGYSWLWEGDIALTQNLFNGMGTVNRHSAAIDREEAAKYSMDDVREMLTSETVNAYMDVLRAEDSLRYIAEYKAALEKYRPQFKVLIDQGAVDSTDHSQAFDMIARASKLENDFNAQKQSAIARYAMMTGHEPQGELHAPKVILNIPETQDMAVAWALENHPQLRAANESSDAAWHDSLAEKSAFFPKLDSELSYYKKDQDDVIGGEVVDARALLKMNWAFSTGGAEISRYKRSRKLYQQSLSERREKELQLVANIKDAWIMRDKLTAQQDISARRLALSKALLNTRRDQFEGGSITLLQLMQAHDQHYMLGLENRQLGYAAQNADYMILSSMGALYSRLTPEAALVIQDVQQDAAQPEIEKFCDHQQEHQETGKGKSDGKASEVCP